MSVGLERSPFLTQAHPHGQGRFQPQTRLSKSTKAFTRRVQCHHKVRAVLHSSSYWCHPSAVSLSSVWPLCFGCIFWGPAISSQSPLFVLHRLIHFKLLPNSSSLPSLERSPFVPQNIHRLSLCARWPGLYFYLCCSEMSRSWVMSLFPPHSVSCHCDLVREESSATGRNHQKFTRTCSMLMSSWPLAGLIAS